MTPSDCCELVPADGASPGVVLRGATLLPSSEAPEVVICPAAGRRWLVADRQGLRALDEGTELRLQGRVWRLRRRGAAEAPPTLRFRVSQDEEHVRLALSHGADCCDLGERVHHQTLLLLARERRADEACGVAAAECGWRAIGSLERMLGIAAEHFSIHVFRARRQAEPWLCAHAVALPLVERRSGQARFGALAFVVEPWRAAGDDAGA